MALDPSGSPQASLPRASTPRLSVHRQVDGAPQNPGTTLLSKPPPLLPAGPRERALLRTVQASAEKKGLLSPAHCGHVDPREKGSSRGL